MQRRRQLLALCSAGFALLAGCQTTAPAGPTPEATRASFLLLGEQHDNPLHHAQRAAWLRQLAAANRAAGRGTWVVFEQMNRANDAALQQAARLQPANATMVAEAGGLELKAWAWPLHQPLFDAALAGDVHLAGGNLSRDAVRRVVREGRAAVPADLLPLLDAPGWQPADQLAVEADIEASHCGALPPSLFGPMALAQRVRDAAMAQAMLAGAASAPAGKAPQVVLIAGNGHVRSDLGVPFYLRAAGVPAADIVSVAWLEPEGSGESGRYQQVRRTAAATRPDPCEDMKKPG
ncbi:MAG TPA: ChaN family lipoprotein [Ideonella sp.]|uniref:ChaN family lipoprotein n=1 Tax=Ideonella sp. TaxID=1929293 RepID=UPI002CF5F868|nr:ChaN family lipoprotein [Ideonella sp.]HSI48485.1 ChaN family lipoprotein [Ideonella sp.]